MQQQLDPCASYDSVVFSLWHHLTQQQQDPCASYSSVVFSLWTSWQRRRRNRGRRCWKRGRAKERVTEQETKQELALAFIPNVTINKTMQIYLCKIL